MDLYHLPGFLGTKAHFLSDLTLVFIILSAILLSVGVWLAIRKQYEIHRWVQTVAVILNASVILGVMIGSFRGYYLPKIATNLSDVPIAVTTVHAIIGVFGFLFGTFVMLRGNNLVPKRLRFSNYKLFMRISYVLYMIASLSGVIVYLVEFI
ncbi:MAG: DUF420 domain-containing protein [Leptolinea sp.]